MHAIIQLMSERRRQWLTAVLVLFFAALSVKYTMKILDRPHRSAIMRWQPQLRALSEGSNIWNDHIYPNPPMMALLLEPLVRLPPVAASLVWFYLKVILAVFAIGLAMRLAESGRHPFSPWGEALAAVLSLRAIAGDLTHGNVNIFILFTVLAALYAFRHKRDLLAGMLLALSIACKITPALFIPYLVWKRAWSALAGCAGGLLLFFVLIPGVTFGMQRNAEFLTSWVDKMVVPYVVEWDITSDHVNQSLPGFAARMLTRSPSFSDYINNIYTPLEYHNVAEWSSDTVRWLLKGAMLLFAVVVMWSCRTPTNERGDWRFAAECSIIFIGMLLFSERTWKHHCVTLLLPFTVLVYCLLHFWQRKGIRALLISTIALAQLLILSTSTGLFDEHDRFGKLAQTYGAYVWACLLMVGTLSVLLRATPKPAASDREESGDVREANALTSETHFHTLCSNTSL